MNSYMLSSVGGYSMDRFHYCASNDTTCSSCQATWVRDYHAGVQVEANALCVGESGCICIAACALPDRDDSIVENWCSPALDGAQFRLVTGLVIGIVALFVLAMVLAKRQLARRQQQGLENREAQNAARAAAREAQRPAALARLPQLTLSGWTGMREKLVSSEHIQLGRGSTVTRPTLARTVTSLPFDGEEGDGYRPMSPEERSSRRLL